RTSTRSTGSSATTSRACSRPARRWRRARRAPASTWRSTPSRGSRGSMARRLRVLSSRAKPKEVPVRTLRGAAVLALVAALMAVQARAAEPVKIGFITTLSGPAGVIGKHMKDSVELALDHLRRKIAGLETKVIYRDDQRKADVGKQVADE